MEIQLDFGSFTCDAELFATPVAVKFSENLPCKVSLRRWGNELYGSVGIDCGENNPIPEIPAGGIAYTNNGNYLCVFFGQRPAWPVEYIGQITGDSWKQIVNDDGITSVAVSLKK